jgi:hypothetical protein
MSETRSISLLGRITVVMVVMVGSVTAWGRVIYADDDGPADFNNIQATIDIFHLLEIIG